MTWNPYDELGISKDADLDAIHQAYRLRAKETHPDVGGSEEAFANVQLAYAILMDIGARDKFDKTGKFEEPKPDNLRPAALGIILSVFEQIVDAYTNSRFNEHLNPERMDLMGIMKQRFTGEITNSFQNIETGEASIKMMRRLQGRFSSKKKKAPPNPMVDALDLKCKAAEASIENIKKAILVREEAIAILDQYNFSFEQIMQISGGTGGSHTNTIFVRTM
jgi:curved DNA-binding protein CbpA